MATDNTTLNPGASGDAIRDVAKNGVKTQVVILDLGGAGAESLLTGTLPVSAVSLPLPALAATSTNQATEIASLASIDGKITACNTGAVVISSGTITLPVGASTAARQDTGNTSLSSIDGKITACNTGAVVISSGSVTATVTGTVTANAGSNLNTSLLALESGGNLATIAGKDFATQTTLALIKAKTDNLDVASSTLATAARQDTGNTSLATVAAAVFAEDAAATDADKGIPALAVRQNVPASTTGATGDYQWLTTDAQGRLWVNSDILASLMQAQNNMNSALLMEMRMLRTSFQDWSRQGDPRYDPTLTLN